MKKDIVPVEPTKNEFISAAMTPADIVAQVKLVQDVMSSVMQKDQHYGIIPGCGGKPALLKPGAEKLCLLFRLSATYESVETYDGNHLTVKSRCHLTHIPTGHVVGSGEAICSTKEKKYAKRKVDGKVVDNAYLPDSYNTVLKMANKRALVAATLVSTAASDIFTQDLEDIPLVTVDVEVKSPTLAEIVEKADEKHEAKKVDSYTPEVKEPPKKEPGIWRGKLDKVLPEELPGGRPCWTLKAHDGTEFRTADKAFEEVIDGINGEDEYEIHYTPNSKGTFVITKMGDAK